MQTVKPIIHDVADTCPNRRRLTMPCKLSTCVKVTSQEEIPDLDDLVRYISTDNANR